MLTYNVGHLQNSFHYHCHYINFLYYLNQCYNGIHVYLFNNVEYVLTERNNHRINHTM